MHHTYSHHDIDAIYKISQLKQHISDGFLADTNKFEFNQLQYQNFLYLYRFFFGWSCHRARNFRVYSYFLFCDLVRSINLCVFTPFNSQFQNCFSWQIGPCIACVCAFAWDREMSCTARRRLIEKFYITNRHLIIHWTGEQFFNRYILTLFCCLNIG